MNYPLQTYFFAWVIYMRDLGPIIMVASAHKEQYSLAGWLLQNEVVMKGTGCVTTAVKKTLRLSFIYFILWNYVLFKVFFNYSFDLYLCAFKVHRKPVYCCSRVGKRCMTACILSVASSCGWIESGQSVWSFYTRTLKPWTSGNFIKWSDLQFYINVVK